MRGMKTIWISCVMIAAACTCAQVAQGETELERFARIRAESAQQAIDRYPHAGVPGTPLYQRMTLIDQEWKAANDPQFYAADKPIVIAEKAMAELKEEERREQENIAIAVEYFPELKDPEANLTKRANAIRAQWVQTNDIISYDPRSWVIAALAAAQELGVQMKLNFEHADTRKPYTAQEQEDHLKKAMCVGERLWLERDIYAGEIRYLNEQLTKTEREYANLQAKYAALEEKLASDPIAKQAEQERQAAAAARANAQPVAPQTYPPPPPYFYNYPPLTAAPQPQKQGPVATVRSRRSSGGNSEQDRRNQAEGMRLINQDARTNRQMDQHTKDFLNMFHH